ncbi:hypothetical protein B0H15DRAFT_931873 [Mycena belliarum]|uniref:PWWP domain-containing protein n=1 Tax=Mycena belliarum TaxID=1033014 RepID=A0AAD6U2V4_9AGAR|nr:hypothetical protein B0H15DRAFT_931873 [Mycena belliae]
MSAKKSSTSAKKSESESFDLRDIVLGKIRGFPPWPGMVVDPDAVPKAVSKARPAGKKSAVYAVRFFPTGDYAWLPPKELTRLTSGAIKAFVDDTGAARKSGELMEAYRKAQDPTAWEEEHAAASEATKKPRKSKAKAKKSEDVDEEDEIEEAPAEDPEDEAEEEEEEKKAGKKRKRASSPAPPKAKAPKAPAKNGKKGGKAKKSKAAVESEDEGGDAEAASGEAGEEEEPRAGKKAKVVTDAAKLESDPEALKVREWRHKLQKTFLSNKSLPKEDDMPDIDTLFTAVEGYQDMNIDYLTFSKIGKVMRHIHLLEANKVPRDEEFKFRERAKALVDKWHQILNANKGGEGAAAAAAADGAAADGAAEGDLTVMDVTMDEAA